MAEKIKSQKDLIRIVKDLKKEGEKIVTFNGSFDLLHPGHISSLKEAKEQGDILIILLNSDQSVKKYKGPNRPIVPQKDRAEMLAGLESVDYVVLFDEINPKRILSEIKPDVHCNGPDWGKNCVERATVEEGGGRIHVLSWVEGFSTTTLVQNVLEGYSEPEKKAVFLDRDGVININEPEFVHKIEDFKFAPGALEALKKLSNTDYKIIIVTNQSGIGRGYYSEQQFEKLNNWMLDDLKDRGVEIDKVYFCPHHPNENCSCRKPKIGMLLEAVDDFGISLNESWLVGDSKTDVMAGRESNVKTIKIGAKMPKELKLEPHYYASNLLEAVKIIENEE